MTPFAGGKFRYVTFTTESGSRYEVDTHEKLIFRVTDDRPERQRYEFDTRAVPYESLSGIDCGSRVFFRLPGCDITATTPVTSVAWEAEGARTQSERMRLIRRFRSASFEGVSLESLSAAATLLGV